MKKIKLIISLLAALGMIFTSTGCGGADDIPAPYYPNDPYFPGGNTAPEGGNTGTESSSTLYTVSYYSEDPSVGIYLPSNKQVKSGYKLTAADLPTSLSGAKFTVDSWFNTDTMQTVSVGYTVKGNLVLSPRCSMSQGGGTTSEGGKSGYLVIKFDVSDVNKNYSLSLEAPADLEYTAAECGAREEDGAYADMDITDDVPQIADQIYMGNKYKVLWEFTFYSETKYISGSKNVYSKHTGIVSGHIGEAVTLKAVLKKYGTVSFTASRGTITDTLEVYETQEIKMSDCPEPKASLRLVYGYKLNDNVVFSIYNDKSYEGTGEDVTFDVIFAEPKIGDIILTDGRVKRGDSFNSETDTPLAVLFYLGDSPDLIDDYLAVGIEKASEIEWSNLVSEREEDFYLQYMGNDTLTQEQKKKFESMYYTDDYKDNDGSDNYAILKELDSEGVYPAFDYAENYGLTHGAEIDELKTGWYLPTIDDCSYLVVSLSYMNQVLNKIGANFCAKTDGIINVNDYTPWTSNVNQSEPYYCWIQPEDPSLVDDYHNYICKPNYFAAEAITLPSEKRDAFAIIRLSKD